MEQWAPQSGAFDIIYLDPPFRMKDKARLLQNLGPGLFKPQTVSLLHLPRAEEGLLPATLASGLSLEQVRYYGGSALAVYAEGG